jgi:exodeoxyribonuclease VII small subunit
MMTKNSQNSEPDITDLSFEQALARLEETVQTLESGGLDLAEATRLYEEGMKLGRICSEMLAATELKISRIQTSYGEQMRMLEQEELGQEDGLD